ncbi:hypothetical protein PY365_14665 [Roseiarcaceae bacterium H3SJ34-1]|uniref:hypothetical protein n=1 Tax=Terripilifer ovatus TaxID=3032367 RepID=UPI003AB9664E|nr:hypothetical protein [Roseiarcaceae bacterium H3SJ34-1]
MRRLLGAIAGGTAAYALVFNLFLLGILTAPRAYADLDGSHVLCITSPGTTAPDGSVPGHSGSGTGTHCPICLGRGPVGGMPPQMAVHFERLAIRINLAAAPAAPVMPSAPVSAHRARGPPQDI